MRDSKRAFKITIKKLLPLEIKKLLKYLISLKNVDTNKIIVVCMPKSGSTYIYKKLCRYTNYPKITLRSHHEIQEFDRLRMIYHKRFDLIDQIHVVGSLYAVNQINSVNAKVIILWRNLYDLAISMADFLNSAEVIGDMRKTGYANTFGGVIDEKFYNLDKDEQYDFVITFVIPAYIRFYVSWKKCEQYLNIKPLWISYERFFSNKDLIFKEILRYCNLEINDQRVLETLNALDATRFNKGVCRKRGSGELSWDKVKKIENIAAIYPEYYNELLNPTHS